MCIRDSAASGPDDELARFSNFGAHSVDLAAPGIGVLSTLPVSYTHLRAHETVLDLVCRLLLEKQNKQPLLRVPHPVDVHTYTHNHQHYADDVICYHTLSISL